MLELDLVLGPFVTERYEHLSEMDRGHFAQLMECEDQDLFAWLLQRGQPEERELVEIVGQILEFTRTPLADR